MPRFSKLFRQPKLSGGFPTVDSRHQGGEHEIPSFDAGPTPAEAETTTTVVHSDDSGTASASPGNSDGSSTRRMSALLPQHDQQEIAKPSGLIVREEDLPHSIDDVSNSAHSGSFRRLPNCCDDDDAASDMIENSNSKDAVDDDENKSHGTILPMTPTEASDNGGDEDDAADALLLSSPPRDILHPDGRSRTAQEEQRAMVEVMEAADGTTRVLMQNNENEQDGDDNNNNWDSDTRLTIVPRRRWRRRLQSATPFSLCCSTSSSSSSRSYWKGWTRRERILLAIVAFNTVLVILLLGITTSSVQRSNREHSRSFGAVVGSGSTTTCGGDGSTTASNSQPSTPASGITQNSAPAAASTATATTTASNSNSGGSGSSNGISSSSTQQAVGDPFSLCGCAACTQSIWDTMAGEFSCGDRILYLQDSNAEQYPTQVDACRRIAFEYPCVCGGCDPGRCNLPSPDFLLPSNWVPPLGSTPAPTPVTAYNDPTQSLADATLYCYPAPDLRKTYSLWSDFQVQVKESDSLCGPGDNSFSNSTVIVNESDNTLTLRYTKAQGSEVRVFLIDSKRPFTYGTYSFSVRSVEVKDSTGNMLSNVLPKELVFGMFTWDDTEKYAIHENFNHEVDIEISRWNCDSNADLQFLVQPPGFPQMHRLFTGDGLATSMDGKYDQGGHVYEFTWNPGQINWQTTAGKDVNNEFSLMTSEAMYRGLPDYVQCMPDIGGNTEVRINLWNMLGAQQPGGLSFYDTVEVVIDSFSFTPSGLTHLAEGNVCSKTCQCEAGVAECTNGLCTNI
jgi:hypothetical protein